MEAMKGWFLILPLIICAGVTPRASAQADQPVFEVASIRTALAGRDGGRVRTLSGGRTFAASNVTLKNLIMTAYSVRADQVSGGPGWASSDTYDVEAKAGRAVGPAELMQMLQTLLADRFRLILDDQKRVQSVSALILERPAANLKRNSDGSESLFIPAGVGKFRGANVSMPYLAWTLSRLPDVGRVVIDKTSLSGGYDFDLQFTMALIGQNAAGTTPEPGPSVFTALKEQLGLRLESAREPVDFFVIDRVERPSEN